MEQGAMTTAWQAPPPAPAAKATSNGDIDVWLRQPRIAWEPARSTPPESAPSSIRALHPDQSAAAPRVFTNRLRHPRLESGFSPEAWARLTSKSTVDFQTSKGSPPVRSPTIFKALPRARLLIKLVGATAANE
eukprot:CAMPEP_0171705004 /NCGR_PEP_ID=MMETSP0991-20121206/12959_1 /TAXON_ID=483369 /ORGANISM="non described non described, Strain CCMP2098" /LENGTH=132 /DNA_ID=CAMNT_0012294507 /DNA_START=731 /DNA_END=1126 /DNA_ORIENTATION=+